MSGKKAWNYGKRSTGSAVFDVFNTIFMLLLVIITLYPFLHVLFASFSNPSQLMTHRGLLLGPVGFSIRGYELVFRNSYIIDGFFVSVFVTIIGTFCNLFMTSMFAYVLSRRGMLWHAPLTIMVVFTMYFSGGMIPLYFVVRNLNLLDSIWSLILPGLISTYNLIIVRTAFQGVPGELEESARLDGAGEIRILTRVILPLCMPTLAAIGLFYAVGHWNSWAAALLYIQTPNRFPLQLVLRGILIQQEGTSAMMSGVASYEAGEDYAARQLLKYSTIIISIVPIICVYPFLQKYFTKGIMIGALKG